ncbi:MAG: SDR family NAD(P)-dependent oxidoreductase [Chloroflexi bacterium]|nr:SDR family NAD(P)-dependent oxidoreductase [Chloroflexota bacterium]
MPAKNKWTALDIPDQSGKVVIITGANSGIGYEAAGALAKKGATVVMACRNLEKGEAAAKAIIDEGPTGQVVLLHLDLADLSSVRRFADEFSAEYDRLDVLVNNGGIMAVPKGKTVDGFEMQIGTNHLGHYALTGLLIEMLKTTQNARVVTVSSYAHNMGKINFDDLSSEKSYQRWSAYGRSKLANVLFGYELQRRLAANGHPPISLVVHPGYAATNLQRNTGLFSFANHFFAQSQEMGALPTLYAATSADIQGGEYIGPDGLMGQRGYPQVARSSRASHNELVAKRLWEVSEELTGVQFGL